MRGTRVFVGRLPYQARERDVERFFKGYGRVHEILLKNGYGFVEFDDPRDADDAVYELNGKTLCGERVTIEHARGPSRGIRGSDRGMRGRGGGGGRRDDYGRNNDRGRYGGGSYNSGGSSSRYGSSSGGGGGGGGSGDRSRPSGGSRTSDGRPGWEEKYGPTERTEWRLRVENLSTRVRWQDLKDYMRQAGDVTYTAAHNNEPNEGIVEFSSKKDMTNAIEKLDGTEMNGRKIKLVTEEVTLTFKNSSNSRDSRRSYSRSRSKSRSVSRSRSRSPRRSRSRSSRSHSKSSRSRSRSPVNGRSPVNDR